MHGSLYIIAAPSGAGKTSLVKALLGRTDNLTVSISHTTRAARPGEQDGVDYHFVSQAKFEQLISEKAFLEHAKVFDNYYGTTRKSVETTLAAGQDVILEIDWQGAKQVKKAFSASAEVESIGIFILPPSIEVLRNRLSGRDQDSEAIIDRRMKDAVAESSHFHEFDYLVINDDFEVVLEELKSIIICQRQTLKRQKSRQEQLLRELKLV